MADFQKLLDQISEEYRKMSDHAEFHAYSVRQLIAQRTRHFALFGLVADALDGTDVKGLAPVLRSVEKAESQFLQDIMCLVLNRGKRDGFFVEFGACDGLAISNTMLLERDFGWSGILAEPGKKWHEALRSNRNCTIDERCVWSKSGESVTFLEHENALQSSADLGQDDLEGQPSYDVETISLKDLLGQHNAPTMIDYMSVDVEGAEHDILQAFPFSEYRFGFISIEHHTQDEEARIKELMDLNGYSQILRNASGFDGFYVPKDRVL